MRKFYFLFFLFFVLYGLAVGGYLLSAERMEVGAQYQEGPADPHTYMTPQQVEQALAYSRTRDVVFFIGPPYEWAVYLLILGLGLSAHFRRMTDRPHLGSKMFGNRLSPTLRQTAVYVALLFTVVALLKIPLNYYLFRLQHEYGISHQPLVSWLADWGKGLLVSILLAIPVVWLLYKVINRSKRLWWVWFWLLSIPLMAFLMFIQPVVLDPIYNTFQPLQNEELRQDILSLAERAEIPAEQVYQVDMSKKTSAMNAYVNGIGSNMRIVLWDTTLAKMEPNEVLFIMAHEMGHYVYDHMGWMFLGSVGSTLAMLFVLFILLGRIIRSAGRHWEIRAVGDVASLPLILLLVSVISFATAPVSNSISRAAEHAADEYAIQMTADTEAAIGAFQKLAISALSEPDPPFLVKLFRHTHPTMVERIQFIQDYENKLDFVKKREVGQSSFPGQ